jgi:hypothetical protein
MHGNHNAGEFRAELAHLLKGIDARAIGQKYIGEEKIERRLAYQFERFGATSDRLRNITGLRQHGGDFFQQFGMIFQD